MSQPKANDTGSRASPSSSRDSEKRGKARSTQAGQYGPQGTGGSNSFLSVNPKPLTPTQKARASTLRDFPFPVPPVSADQLASKKPTGMSEPAGVLGGTKKALDLFSGSGSVARRLEELGYEVVTLDKNSRCRPDIVADILRWPFRKYFSPGYFDLIVASPPCEMYSQARTTARRPRDFTYPDRIVKRTLDIIKHFDPPKWWIENPAHGHLGKRPFMTRLPYCDVDYCQFSDWGYQKPTRIWGSPQIASLPNVKCNRATCPHTKEGNHGIRVHVERLGGEKMKFSTAEKGIVPSRLVDYLLQEGVYSNNPTPPRSYHVHERYQVKLSVVEDALHQLGQLQPDTEVFADPRLHMFPRWLGPGSSTPDAFAIPWSDLGLLWCNPPFSQLGKVVSKIRADKARAVLIVPNWQGHQWFQEARDMTQKRVFYPEGSKVFEVEHGRVGGVKWGVWALLVDGTHTGGPTTAAAGVHDSGVKGTPCKVHSHQRSLPPDFTVNSIHGRKHELQLVMLMAVALPDDSSLNLKVLVDTGAQANLIRMGLVPDSFLYTSSDPLSLRMANGQYMEGGRRVVDTHLGFRHSVNGELMPSLFWRPGTFYEADIKVDAILSFPWLVEHQIAVVPHLKALAILEPELSFLMGVSRNPRPVSVVQAGDTRCPWAGEGVPQGGAFRRRRRRSRRQRRGRWAPIHNVIAEPWDDEEELRMQLGKLRLQVPTEEPTAVSDFLSDKELSVVGEHLKMVAADSGISSIVISEPKAPMPESWDQARLNELREGIHRDFDGTALRAEVIPDPPVRGMFGYAYIPLKEGAVPTREKPFSMHGERQEAMKKIVLDWIEKKFIERPQQGGIEWLSQGFAVAKKSTTFPWRGVADMRGPNSQTRRCSYPLPCIEDILVKQGSKQIFSILDLRQAFHQQPLHPDSRHITCTNTPLGVYQWRVNVMGLKNAGIQFQMMIDDRLHPVRDVADAYIDDIIIGTRVGPGEDLFAAHDRDLRRVLSLLAEEKLVADIGKCRFFVPEVEFCGHILRNGTRSPAPGKLSAIENWERPTTITELRAFLGFTNYYSSYVQGYSDVVARLQDKLKVPREVGKKGSKARIDWSDSDEECFQEIKRRLCANLVLQRVNPDRPFVLRTDASTYAVGATLEQLREGDGVPSPEDVLAGKTVPVAFMSRKLTSSQRNWVPREQETYAIILALQKWESWIGLQPVLVLTDHKALEAWSHEVLDPPSGPLGRRSRWHQILSKYDLTVGYIAGKDNTVADILSRWTYPASQALRDISIHGSDKDDKEMKCIEEEERRTERACVYMYIIDPPLQRNSWVRGITGKSGRKEEPAATPPARRFFFKRPQGVQARRDVQEEPTPVASPPQRRAGEGAPVLRPAGVEEPSSPDSHPDSFPDPFPEFHSGPSSEAGDSAGGEEDAAAPPPTSPRAARPPTPSSSSSSPVPQPVAPAQEAVPPARELNTAEYDCCNWEAEYHLCPTFTEPWSLTHGLAEEWPPGYRLIPDRLLFEGRICIPSSLQKAHIRLYHEHLLHPGWERLWKDLKARFEFADLGRAKDFVQVVGQQCETCQACQRPYSKAGPLVFTPIPPHIMVSIAIDIFDVSRVDFEGRMYDSMAVCVDRHSGWMVAVPCTKKI